MPLEREDPDFVACHHEVEAALGLTDFQRELLTRMNEMAFFKVETEVDRRVMDEMIEQLRELTAGARINGDAGMESWYTEFRDSGGRDWDGHPRDDTLDYDRF